MSIERLKVGPRMSQIVIHGNTVYCAGQVAEDRTADVQDQTRQILAKIEGLLAEAGTDKSHLLSAQVWVNDISYFALVNEIWDAWVTPGKPPARACIGANLVDPNLKVEIMVVAALP